MVTMLQSKGLAMVMIVVYLESVSRVQAATFWSKYFSYPHGKHYKNTDGSSSGSGSGSGRSAVAYHADGNLPNGCHNHDSDDHDHPPSRSTTTDSATAASRRGRHSTQQRENNCENMITTTTTTAAAAAAAAAVDNCCVACSECMDTAHYDRQCGLDVRGGQQFNTDSSTATAATTTTPYDIPLNLWKVIFQCVLTSINVFCWLAPLKHKNFSQNEFGLSMANAFSGGVFLSLAFGHLLPECLHGFQRHNEALPFMIALGGYLLIFFVEKVAFDTQAILEGAGHQQQQQQQQQQQNHTTTTNNQPNGSGAKQTKHNTTPSINTGRSAVILLGALAVHSILEMTALGLADTFADSALLSLSIALHQPAESIALLVAFLKSGLSEQTIITYLSIFSVMGPIGVALGMAVNEFAAPIVDAIMLATVAGTFIYVGATEIIPEEWENHEHRWKKFFALLSGILSIFAITQYTQTLEK